ncbi:hypothetical protein BV898_16265 [Hypsibius exemplaris]|uniref:Uncharacterized protein n=1 Tax=Hypsibius exemplaris TaxID=2072580 RepID=A0A9X6RL42_HYPEX|nr:hypothetical protein BV898_16265 [Hypsibius exemplaris]
MIQILALLEQFKAEAFWVCPLKLSKSKSTIQMEKTVCFAIKVSNLPASFVGRSHFRAALSNGRVGGSQNAEQARSFPIPVKVGTTSMVIQTNGSALETTAQLHGSSVPMQGIVPYEVPSDQQIQSFRSLIPRSDYLPAGVLPPPDSRA